MVQGSPRALLGEQLHGQTSSLSQVDSSETATKHYCCIQQLPSNDSGMNEVHGNSTQLTSDYLILVTAAHLE